MRIKKQFIDVVYRREITCMDLEAHSPLYRRVISDESKWGEYLHYLHGVYASVHNSPDDS